MAVSGRRSQNLARRHRAVHAGQREIHHDHARDELGGQLHGLVPVARPRPPRDLRVVLQHAAEAAPHQAVIVHQQDGNASVQA